MKTIRAIQDWLINTILMPFIRKQAAEIIVQLLTSINPHELANQIRPHLEAAMKRMPTAWQRAFVLALQKLVEIASASIPESQ